MLSSSVLAAVCGFLWILCVGFSAFLLGLVTRRISFMTTRSSDIRSGGHWRFASSGIWHREAHSFVFSVNVTVYGLALALLNRVRISIAKYSQAFERFLVKTLRRTKLD